MQSLSCNQDAIADQGCAGDFAENSIKCKDIKSPDISILSNEQGKQHKNFTEYLFVKHAHHGKTYSYHIKYQLLMTLT